VSGSTAVRDVSIVIPAFNEESRLPEALSQLDAFLADGAPDVEVIIMDDGSFDGTLEIAQRWCAGGDARTAVTMPHGGKARAVKVGVGHAKRGRVLFMDADLAVPLEEIAKLLEAVDSGAQVAIGSRELPGSSRYGEGALRHLRGRAFNWLVEVAVLAGIRDTQCGFKAFTREAAGEVFDLAKLHSGRGRPRGSSVTAFDVELLFIARRLGYTIAEPLRMTLDVLSIRLNDWLGRYPRKRSK